MSKAYLPKIFRLQPSQIAAPEMKNSPVSAQSTNSKQPNNQRSNQPIQLVVFDIDNLKFAVPIQLTYKVVNHETVYGSGLNHMGVTHIDNHEITVIDLHRRLFKANQSSKCAAKNCLVVVQNSMGDLCGIPTTSVPTLMEVPLSMIRVLPESYRHADTLDVASHVAVIPQQEGTLTLFLLDVEQLLPTYPNVQTLQPFIR